MANPNISIYGRGTRFTPGQSGNPGGKPIGARNKIQGDFLNALADDFEAHGKDAIERMREKDPSGYVRVVASLMPKGIEIAATPLEDLTDEELNAAITALLANYPSSRAEN